MKGRVISSLRKLWLQSEIRSSAIRNSRYKKKIGVYKNGKDKMVWFVYCAQCGFESRKESDFNVDHIKPFGKYLPDWTKYIEGMLFCDYEEDLQVLCKSCHNEKTQKERECRDSLKLL